MNVEHNIGAFFDLDGTLLPAPSLERRFIGFLLRQRLLRFTSLARWFVDVLEDAPIGTPFAEAARSYLAGLPTSLAEGWLADQRAPLPFFAEGLRAVEWHAARGHRIAIVSGTLAPLARAAARQLPAAVSVCATELKTCDSASLDNRGGAIWNGRLAQECMNGGAKARAIRSVAARDGLDLSRSFAYGDSSGDIAMLAAVGNPRAVNPAFSLRRIARVRRWPTERWVQKAVDANGYGANASVAASTESER
jgi:HAD superfamily hydrolase (TIGR01490 family)